MSLLTMMTTTEKAFPEGDNPVLTLGQQGPELFPGGFDEVRSESEHDVYAPSSREASDTPRIIEHPVPVYMLIRSLLAEPLRRVRARPYCPWVLESPRRVKRVKLGSIHRSTWKKGEFSEVHRSKRSGIL